MRYDIRSRDIAATSARRWAAFLAVLLLPGSASAQRAAVEVSPAPAPGVGVKIGFRIPIDPKQTLPATYRVTLSITPKDEPDWIVANFLSGAAVVVDEKNRGQFEAIWDGLDDNGMPVPPGEYRCKGIFMPSRKWEPDGRQHSIRPKYLMGIGDSWAPPAEQDMKPPIIAAHQFGFMADIDAAPNGMASFRANYIEAASNPFLVDLNAEIGYDQVKAKYSSHLIGPGTATACDGTNIWFAVDKYLVRADRRWGENHNGLMGVKAKVPAAALAVWRDPATRKPILYAVQSTPVDDEAKKPAPIVGEIVAYDGDSAKSLGVVPIEAPIAIYNDRVRPGTRLLVVHKEKDGWAVSELPLKAGIPTGARKRLFGLDPSIGDPVDADMDSAGRTWITSPSKHHVFQLDAAGKIAKTLGEPNDMKGQAFSPKRFYLPRRISIWRKAGEEFDRILVLEGNITGRISEWTTNGDYLRQWWLARTAVSGGVMEPDDPEHVWIANGVGPGIMRYKIDYQKNSWEVDYVQPDVPAYGSRFPRIVRHAGHKYLCYADGWGTANYSIFRWTDDRGWFPSAGFVWKDRKNFDLGGRWWHDANGNGTIDDDEFTGDDPTLRPTIYYWGDLVMDDLSLLMRQPQKTPPGMPNGWHFHWWYRSMTPAFDPHGNPIYDPKKWKQTFDDDVFHKYQIAKAAPRLHRMPDPLHGGNEDHQPWVAGFTAVDGNFRDGFYFAYTSGPPNVGGLDLGGGRNIIGKVCYFAPDGKGNYEQKWRVGRKAWRVAQMGEMYCPFQLTGPVHGMLGINDQNGVYHVYHRDGSFVDTLMYDGFAFNRHQKNQYSHGGEFWFGKHFLNSKNGKVYLLMGRSAGNLYECEGWTPDLVKNVQVDDGVVSISAGQIAAANPYAVKGRGGAAKAGIPRFMPAPGGGPALDGSLHGWETADPVKFQIDPARAAEVRCAYDPETLYLRYHVRTPNPAPAPDDASPEQIFTHGRQADTVSFYLQGNPAAPASREQPRPGDVRFVFAIVGKGDESRALALGMYPYWDGKPARPVTYASPVRKAAFEHVAILDDARIGHTFDADGKGFTIAVALPRRALPKQLPPLGEDLRTNVDFSVSLGGTTAFWWANTARLDNTNTTDEPSEAMLYPGSWAPAQFQNIRDLPVRAWMVSGPWGSGEFAKAPADWNARCKFVKTVFEKTKFPPEMEKIDFAGVYRGPETTNVKGQQIDLRWKLQTTASDRIFIGQHHQHAMYFAVAYVHVPEAGEFEVKSIGQRGLFGGGRLWVNDMLAATVADDYYGVAGRHLPETQTIRLNRGWNRLVLGGYNTYYDGWSLGLVFKGSPEQLWRIKIAPQIRGRN